MRVMRTVQWSMLLSAVLATAATSYAYGPISVTSKGAARSLQDFDGSSSNGTHRIDYYPENVNGCGSRTNSQMTDFVATTLSGIPTASIDGTDVTDVSLSAVTASMTDENGSLVTSDITGSNYTTVYVVNGDSATSKKVTNDQFIMLYDSDGSITAAIDGVANRCVVLGFAGMILVNDTSTVDKSQMVINCAHDSTTTCPGASATDTDVKTVILHEFSHGLGLDHSMVDLAGANTTTTSDDTTVPTMYPVLVNASEMSTYSKDDVAGLAALYPNSTLTSSFGTISGTVVDKNSTQMPCVEVEATNTSDSSDVVSTVTGYEGNSPEGNFPDDCTTNCGIFTLEGLKNGATYQLKVQNIQTEFSGGSSIGRCDPPKTYDLDGDGTAADSDSATLGSTVTASANTTSTVTITTAAEVDSSSSGGDSGGDDSSSDSSTTAVCALVRDGVTNPAYSAVSLAIFVFTALGLLATGRRCATRRP